MDVRALRYFVAVAETQNLSRAAERLNVVQSALSHQIRRLEEELGTQLFERHGRRVRLSAIGRVFLDEANGILQGLERAKDRVAHAVEGRVGSLGVGFQTVACRHREISEALREFGARNPDVDLRLSPINSGQMIEDLVNGDLDAGFVYLLSPRPALDSLLIAVDDWLLAIPKGHPLCDRKTIRLRDLNGEGLIWSPRSVSPEIHDRLMSRLVAGGLTPKIAQEAFEVMFITLVSVGMGIAFVVETAKDFYAPDSGVEFRKVVDFSMPMELRLAWRRDNQSPILARLVDTVQRLQKAPSGPKSRRGAPR